MTMVKIAASLRELAPREAGVVRRQAGRPPPTATLSHNESRPHLSNEGTGGRSSVDPESRSDEQLLTASATDPEAFVALYDRHAKRILAFFVRQTFEAQVAADLTAETFAQAFASRGRFRNPGPGSAESPAGSPTHSRPAATACWCARPAAAAPAVPTTSTWRA